MRRGACPRCDPHWLGLGDSRGRRDEESFGKHGYTKQEFSGEELVNVEEDEDMEDEDDMIEFEESFDDEE